jgi:hypothetical protein
MNSPPPPDLAPVPSRNRGGRPRKTDDELRSETVAYRATPAEFAALEARAAEAGLSVSAFVRETIHDDPPPSHRRGPAAGIGPIVAQLARLGNNLNQILREARFGNFPPEVAALAEEALKAAGDYLRKLAGAADDPET